MRHSKPSRPTLCLLSLAALSLLAVPSVQAQQCVPFLAYLDLNAGGGNILTHPNFTVTASNPAVNSPSNPDCAAADFRAAVLEVKIPAPCSCAIVWVEYVGEPEGWTVNIGDSQTNNGFGGDAGTVPAGQNAEVHVLDQELFVYGAADNPADVDLLLRQQMGLQDGTLKFVVCDQKVSVGQPYAKVETPDLDRLFFLDPGDDNRTVYVGLNRVIQPFDGQNKTRNGCGARRALAIFQ